MRVAVVVLGDLARSPRMLYQALALADRGHDVDLLGYRETALEARWQDHDHITLWPLPSLRPPHDAHSYGPLRLAGRLAVLTFALFRTLLWSLPRPDILIIQNPPAFPLLAVAWLARRTRGGRVVVDWHNLSSSMAALRLDRRHPLVRLLRVYEMHFGRSADAHFCVSQAMGDFLQETARMRAVHVLRDMPAQIFHPIGAAERHETRRRWKFDAEADRGRLVIVTATSWGLDEDFRLLLDALGELDRRLGPGTDRPILLIASGRGPGRSGFELESERLRLERIEVRTGWWSLPEYAALLAAADLGLSLHRSASGLDLPMKALDMLGAGLPLLALDYGGSLGELIRDGRNGVLFADAVGLADAIAGLIAEPERLARLRANVGDSRLSSWDAQWERTALPILEKLGAS